MRAILLALALVAPLAAQASPTGAQCRASEGCRYVGACTAKGNRCIITTAGCRASEGCRSDGLCAATDGRCAVTAEGCRASVGCQINGACVVGNRDPIGAIRWAPICVVPGQRAVQADPTDVHAGCRTSWGCRYEGACALKDGRCVVTLDGCLASQVCALYRLGDQPCILGPGDAISALGYNGPVCTTIEPDE